MLTLENCHRVTSMQAAVMLSWTLLDTLQKCDHLADAGISCRAVLNHVYSFLQQLPDVFSTSIVCNVDQIMQFECPVHCRQETRADGHLPFYGHKYLCQIAATARTEYQRMRCHAGDVLNWWAHLNKTQLHVKCNKLKWSVQEHIGNKRPSEIIPLRNR